MKMIAIKKDNGIKIASITKTAGFVGVHPNTVSRWINSGDRVVYKNGCEIFLNVEKL